MEKKVKWFNKRREKAQNLTSLFTPKCEKCLHPVWAEVGILAPTWINANELVVQGGDFNVVVNLKRMTCTCKKFDLEKLSCEHALRVVGEI